MAPAAKRASQDICNVEDKDHAAKAIGAFAKPHGAKYLKAVAGSNEIARE
ncbi:hypothetical protein [Streptomyces sp. NBC_01615]